MTPDQYRTVLDKTHALPVAQVAAIVRALPAPPTPDQWRRFLAAMYALVAQARGQARDAAVKFYVASGATAPTVGPLLYDINAVAHLLDRVVKPRLVPNGPARDVTVNAATMAVQRHIDLAARNTTQQLVSADRKPLGWARVLTGRENCAFCITLASRGPAYKTEKTAGGMDSWHDGCDCLAVPVFNRNSWPGRDTYLYAKDVYASAPGKPSIANVRRYLDSLESTQSSAA